MLRSLHDRHALTNPVLFPARLVDKIGEHEVGILMTRGFGRNDDQDHEEGHQGCVERGLRDGGEDFAVAIEQERKGVDDLITDEDVPRLVGANVVS